MPLSLVPLPSRLKRAPGRLELGARVVFISEERNHGIQLQIERISKALSLPSAKGRVVWVDVEISKAHGGLGAEGYRLKIRREGVLIQASALDGVRHAASTLLQLRESSKGGHLEALDIEDKPAFGWRGVLVDSCRHFVSLAFLRKVVDEMAALKFNRLHWHLTDDQAWCIEIKKYPRLARDFAPQGHYKQAELKEFIAYAAARGVSIVPEIEMPGHATAALAAFPKLSCQGKDIKLPSLFGIQRHVFCAGNEAAYRFLGDVLKEVVALFPSPQIHIGCDEVKKDNWQACPKCQAAMRRLGLKDEKKLQSHFAARCVAILRKLGREAVCWDEINEGGAPKGVIVQCWHSGHKPSLVAQAVKNGLRAISSPTEFCYFDYSNWSLGFKKASQFELLPRGLNARQKKLVLGGECAMWSEFIPQRLFMSRLFPRAFATAEVLWRGKAAPGLLKRAQGRAKALARRGVQGGAFEGGKSFKAIPWEPAWWNKKFSAALKLPKPPGW
jgi:hexosaminidase